MLENTPEAW